MIDIWYLIWYLGPKNAFFEDVHFRGPNWVGGAWYGIFLIREKLGLDKQLNAFGCNILLIMLSAYTTNMHLRCWYFFLHIFWDKNTNSQEQFVTETPSRIKKLSAVLFIIKCLSYFRCENLKYEKNSKNKQKRHHSLNFLGVWMHCTTYALMPQSAAVPPQGWTYVTVLLLYTFCWNSGRM